MTSNDPQWIWLAVTLLVFAGVIFLDVFMYHQFGTEGTFSYVIGLGFQTHPVWMAIVLILVGMLWGHAMFPVSQR